jgi:pimeloyl-ACP methyl ester carboxylesterase
MSPSIEPFQLSAAAPERVLRGKVVRPEGSTARHPYVLILHGFKGFMDWGFFPELARRFADTGIAAVLFNMSGSGVGENPLEFTETEAFAKNTHTLELEDAERVRTAIRSGELAGLDPDRGALFGHSRGGGAALIHAAEAQGDAAYRALVTWAAVDDFDRFEDAIKLAWREEGHLWIPNARTGQQHRMDLDLLHDLEQNRARLDPRAACRRIQTPTLLVHGEADEAVSTQAVDRLATELPPGTGRVLRIPGAGHTFGVGHPFSGPTPEWEQAFKATLEHVGAHLGIAPPL